MHADRDVRRVPNLGQELLFVHHPLDGMPLVRADEELGAADGRRSTRAAGTPLPREGEGGYGHPPFVVGSHL